jgi:PAS domain S-box-containing protein/diguanylate cyclase (GGDEF)-like protein
MLQDSKKTKKLLIEELEELRKKNAELEEIRKGQIEELRKANEAIGCYFPLLEQLNDCIYVIFDRKYEFVNQTFEELFGYKVNEICNPSFDFMDLIAPESRKLVQKKLSQGYRGEFNIQQFEFTGIRKDGKKIECHTSVIFIPYKWGVAVHGILNDISARKRINEELQKTQEEIQTALDSIPTSIFYSNLENQFVKVNDAFCKLLGMKRENILGKKISDLFPNLSEDQFTQYWRDYKEVIETGKARRGMIEMFPSNTGRKWIQTDKMPYKNEQGEIQGVVCLAIDITTIRETEEKLWYLSFHDVFTGLYNRAYFEEEITRLEGSRQFPITVIEMHLQNYATVHDKIGISAGNDLLKSTSELMKMFRTEDVVARIESDKFVALLPLSTESIGETILARLNQALERQHAKSGVKPEISFSIKTAEKGTSLSELLKNAGLISK